MRNQKGFTLLEIMLVVAVLAVLAAILTPIVVHRMEKADITAAQSGVNAIIKAIENFRSDTKEYPDSRNHNSNPDYYYYLYTNGDGPVFDGATWGIRDDNIKNHLILNNPDGDSSYGESGDDYPSWNPGTLIGWHGPYLDSSNSADPWGNCFLVEVLALWRTSGVTVYAWMLSAGPDGEVQTDDSDSEIQGDDIGKWIAVAP